MTEDDVVGAFMGLEKASYEYMAWLIAPYQPNFAIEIGSLLLIQHTEGYIEARVTDYYPRGEFMSSMGEKWLNDIASEGILEQIGLEIKKSKVSYKVRIKVLGSLHGGTFSPGIRKIPQITSKVRLPDKETLRNISVAAMQEQKSGVHIGNYSLDTDIQIMFDQKELNSKRTFIFARAGYGKSNLMKVICSEWKKENGGLLVFDQEGEYATTDQKGRPGVMDKRSALLITNRKMPPQIKNIYPKVEINLTELSPKLVVPYLVPPSKHETVFFAKLMAMRRQDWPVLVELLDKQRWSAKYEDVERAVLGLPLDKTSSRYPSEVDIKPILNNLIPPISKIHDHDSNMIEIVKKALYDGRVVIFDISRIDSHSARLISSIIIKNIFDENKDNFIKFGGNRLIKATFVLEEAHAVLSDPGYSFAPSAFVDLAKEGRKYGLGGIFITQQPGSIPSEIVSQGDNFFVFHLLNKIDLNSLSNANAHYSHDIITQILSEPVRGKSYMWTSHQPFVIPINITHFEDPDFAQPNQSTRIQGADDILGSITRQIASEKGDRRYVNIRKKFQYVENKAGLSDSQKTVTLFGLLGEDEKDYLREKNYLQSANNGEFAVTFHFFNKLRSEIGTSR